MLGGIGAYLFPFYHLDLYSFALIFKEISFLFPLFLSLSSSPAFLTVLLSAPDLPPALALCPFPTVFLRTSPRGVHPQLGGVSRVLRGGVGAPSHLWAHPARGRGEDAQEPASIGRMVGSPSQDQDFIASQPCLLNVQTSGSVRAVSPIPAGG